MSQAQPPTTYHLVTSTAWAAADPHRDYEHPTLESENFIHCTDGADELAATANRYFADETDDLLALEIERARVLSPIRYDDPRRVYSHIYGPLNRDAILRIVPMRRGPDGRWLPPEP